MTDESDVLYFDLVSTNFINQTSTNSPAQYNQSRTIPYIRDPSKWYGAVTQFTINNTSVPVLVPEIQPNQNNVNLTVYTVSLSYGGFTFTEPIIFEQQDLLINVPLPPTSYQDGQPFYDDGYYNIYNYSIFTDMVNTAYSKCWTSLRSAVITLPPCDPPIITYDASTQLFNFIVENDVFVNLNSAPYVNIYMNSALFFLYSFFPSQTTLLNGFSVEKLYFTASIGVVDQTGGLTGTRIIPQELTSLSLWSPVSSIVITSNFLPVQKSIVANPQIYFDGQPYIINNNNSLTQPILIEYAVENNIYNKTINYLPTAQFQFFDLLDNQELYTMDFKFWYRGKSSILYPLYLNSGASCSVKLGFFKKDKFSFLKSIK